MRQEQSDKPLKASAYVDGFNLYFGLRDAGLRRFYWLDVAALCAGFCRPGTVLTRTLYFTANISRPPDKVRRQQTFLEALQTHSPIEIVHGRYLSKLRSCERCGVSWTQHEEKMTDVAIATRLLADGFLNRFDVAFIVSADSDLVPPIDQVREHLPSKRIIVAFPPKRSSKELRQKAHGWFYIRESALSSAQLPDRILTPGGRLIERPKRWA